MTYALTRRDRPPLAAAAIQARLDELRQLYEANPAQIQKGPLLRAVINLVHDYQHPLPTWAADALKASLDPKLDRQPADKKAVRDNEFDRLVSEAVQEAMRRRPNGAKRVTWERAYPVVARWARRFLGRGVGEDAIAQAHKRHRKRVRAKLA
jgi:hypothetical protein